MSTPPFRPCPAQNGNEAESVKLAKSQTHQLRIAGSPNSPPNPRREPRSLPVVTHLSLPASAIHAPSSLPHAASLLSCPATGTGEKLNGVLLVASLLWEGRDKVKHTMRLTKAMAMRFTSSLGLGVNPATFVCKRWGCSLLTKAGTSNGNRTNIWGLPPWANGRTVKFAVRLTPYQRTRWQNRRSLLIGCSEKANPSAACVRQTLRLTSESATFATLAARLIEAGESTAVACFRKSPTKINITGDGDIQSVVSRLPESLRAELLIDGCGVAEFDIKSAHAVLLGMFYDGESGPDWRAERERFNAEALAGFPVIYGPEKEHKFGFLSALNRSPLVAHHASAGYCEFEKLFPLLAAKTARIRWRKPKALGSILRNRLAVIMRKLIADNHADGIHTIPVVDSAVVAMPSDPWKKHQAAFRTAWRIGAPLAEWTGVAPLIEGSNGENYRLMI